MLAIGFSEFGSPQVLHVMELPEPTPAAGEVVVQVTASTVNPSDLMMRSGLQAAIMTGLTPPYVAGMEFSGHIASTGDGVAHFSVGQAVMGVVNPRRPAGGAHAQYVCVPAASVVAVQNTADLLVMATVPMNGLTAIAALRLLELHPGNTLLVTGGAGVLAGYVIQLAKSEGLRVIADAKEADRNDLLNLGADVVVPRGEYMLAEVRKHSPAGVDGLIDTALIGNEAAALVRDGGAVVSVRRSNPITDARLRCCYVAVTDHMGDTASMQRLADLVQRGLLKPRGGQQVPMASASQAHAMMEQGIMQGRAILDFREA
jgi:NADPH:quinone reductase-like Zn-dependent oxidoreductase